MAALVVVCLPGCMTITSRQESNPDPTVYSGTFIDLQAIGFPVFVAVGQADPAGLAYYPMFLWVGLLDLPFSFVADTLLLPITIPEQIALNRQKQLLAAGAVGDMRRRPGN